MIKKMMLAGGWLGFAVGTVTGLLTQGSTWPGILVRASVAALVGGLLLRWYAGLMARCAAQALAERAAPTVPARNLTGLSARPGK